MFTIYKLYSSGTVKLRSGAYTATEILLLSNIVSTYNLASLCIMANDGTAHPHVVVSANDIRAGTKIRNPQYCPESNSITVLD